MSKQINEELYNKMEAEQEKYKEWILSHPPEEILNHTREYTIREDILMAMEFHDLPAEQAQALLNSPSPLGDVFREWDKQDSSYMEELGETVELRVEDVLKARGEPPIYRKSASYAMEHGERDAYSKENALSFQQYQMSHGFPGGYGDANYVGHVLRYY